MCGAYGLRSAPATAARRAPGGAPRPRAEAASATREPPGAPPPRGADRALSGARLESRVVRHPRLRAVRRRPSPLRPGAGGSSPRRGGTRRPVADAGDGRIDYTRLTPPDRRRFEMYVIMCLQPTTSPPVRGAQEPLRSAHAARRAVRSRSTVVSTLVSDALNDDMRNRRKMSTLRL